ncbi:MAG: efflux RND transporter periplasmic adaptor subunit [Desulfohalobiaceae bacterium]
MLFLSLFLPALGQAQGSTASVSCRDARVALIHEVGLREVTEYYQAVGSIQALQETRLGALVRARVEQVLVRPGDRVSPGQELVVLEDKEYRSRLQQAQHELESARAALRRSKQDVEAARARLQEAEPNYRRLSNLQAQNMASEQDLDRARSQFLQAKAGLKQAQSGSQEAQARQQALQEKVFELRIMLGYTRVQAQEMAEVVERLVEPGDVVNPGSPLLRLQSRHNLRMEAWVPEKLLQRLTLGKEYAVHVDPLDQDFKARLSEIQPVADPSSRSFLVKLDLEDPPQEIYPGMFSRLMLGLDTQDLIMVPVSAVRRIGQLPTVQVVEQDRVNSRHVRLGRRIGECVQVLSGLEPGEKILLQGRIPPGQPQAQLEQSAQETDR